MAKHPTSRRTHRQEPGEDDVFVARVLETTAWAKKHSRIIIGGAVVLAVVAVAALYYQNYQATLRAEAATRFLEVRQTAMSGNIPLATRDLETFVDRFGGTPTGHEARLLLAQLYLQQGQPAQARDALGDLADDYDDALGASAAALAAAAYEAEEDFAAAERVYLELGDEAPLGFQRREALEDAARLRADRGELDGAIALYRRLIDEAPEDTAERDVYQLRLAELQARAGAAAATSG